MEYNQSSEMQEPSIDTDKLSYEIFSVLESKFLFGYDDQKLWVPKQISPATIEAKPESQNPSFLTENNSNGLSAIKNQRGKICILNVGFLKRFFKGSSTGTTAATAVRRRFCFLEQMPWKRQFRFPDVEVCRATSAEPGLFETLFQCGPLMVRPDVWRRWWFSHEQPDRGSHNSRVSVRERSRGFVGVIIRTGQILEVSYDYEQFKNWRAKQWARPMARISGDSSADSVDQQWPWHLVSVEAANGSNLGRCGPNVDTDPSPNNVKMMIG
ncbi:hypothetical protein NC651_019631 [Populus alba x Populus x berolinensis]|nr:hypothetical protein NC651_019631 [Populus alba x Populus x berolinensis]